MQSHISAESTRSVYRTAAGQGMMMKRLPAIASVLLALATLLGSPLALAEKPAVIYAGREKPQPREEHYPHYRVLNQSAGYGYSGYGRPGYGHPQTDVNVQLRYQAPSTTIINNNVQIIPPSVPVGNISYSQDNYYINNVPAYPNYQHQQRRYRNYANAEANANTGMNDNQTDYRPPVQPMQNRATQWTEDLGVTPP